MRPAAVDSDRYPLDCLSSPEGQALLSKFRKSLNETGACMLPGFIKSEYLPRLCEEALRGGEDAYYMEYNFKYGNGTEKDEKAFEAFAEDDPRKVEMRNSVRFIAQDEIPTDSPLWPVYNWEGLRKFMAALWGLDMLHPGINTLGNLNYTVMHEGDQQNWHFDNNEFTITLLLQEGHAGGEFMYVPNLRDETKDDVDGVRMAHDQSHPKLKKIEFEPGSLMLFEGRYSYHRVSPLIGNKSRLLSVFAYGEKPEVDTDDHMKMALYGRTEIKEAPKPLDDLPSIS